MDLMANKAYSLTILYTFITLLNIVLMDSRVILLITLPEIAVVIYNIVKGNMRKAFFWHCIFMSACFNFGVVALDTETISSYAKVKLIGPLTLNYIILGVMWVLVVNRKIVISNGSLLLKFRRIVKYFIICGVGLGVLGFVVSENYNFTYFVSNLLYVVVAYLYVDIFIRLYSANFSKQFAVSAICMITASSIASFASFSVFDVKATYSVDETFIYNPIYNLMPCLFIAVFQLKSYNLKFISIIGLVFYVFCAMIMSRGTTFLTAFVVLCLMVYWVYFKKSNSLQIKSLRVFLPVIILFAIPSLVMLVLTGSQITSNKLNQFVSLFQLFNFSDSFSDRIQNIGRSPYVRVAEVLNIIHSGCQDIISLFIGKGYGGYFTDSLNLYAHVDLSMGGYPDDMIRVGRFYNAHTVYPCAILYNGLIGLFCLIKLGFSYLYHIDKTFLVFAGFLLFLYSFYFDTIGLVSYIMVLFGAEYMIDNKNMEASIC